MKAIEEVGAYIKKRRAILTAYLVDGRFSITLRIEAAGVSVAAKGDGSTLTDAINEAVERLGAIGL